MKQIITLSNFKNIFYILLFTIVSNTYGIDILVNGKLVDKETVNNDLKYMEENDSSLKDKVMQPDFRKEIYDSIAIREAIRTKGEELNLENTEEYKQRLEAIKPVIFAKILRSRMMHEEIDNSELLKSYNEEKERNSAQIFYKFSQILVDDEKQAKELIIRLDHGENFAKLAIMYSTDFETKDRGGKVNWVRSNYLPAEYLTTLSLLKKGEYSRTPILFHNKFLIIQLDKVKTKKHFKFPSFQDIKHKLAEKLHSKKLNDYLNKIREELKVELK